MTLSHTIAIAFGNLRMTKSPTYFLSLVSQSKTFARCPSFDPILPFFLPLSFLPLTRISPLSMPGA